MVLSCDSVATNARCVDNSLSRTKVKRADRAEERGRRDQANKRK
jgi:hypothetical protein